MKLERVINSFFRSFLVFTPLLVFFNCFYIEANAEPFPVYDATAFRNKPNLLQYGMLPFSLIYDDKFWDATDSREEPNLTKVTSVARAMDSRILQCVDIERWPLSGNINDINKSISKYYAVAAAIKSTNPAARFGFYGIIPKRDYWRARGIKGRKAYDAWVRENSALTRISTHVDVIFPSLYTFYTDEKGWVEYAIANITEARRYRKAVVCFLWPQYHDSTEMKGQFLPGNYWKTQLETCRKYADGIVIWNGAENNWDDNAAWWAETKAFLAVR